MSNDEPPSDFDETLQALVDDLTQEWQLVAEEEGIPETDAMAQLAHFREWATVKVACLTMTTDSLIDVIGSIQDNLAMLIEEMSQRDP